MKSSNKQLSCSNKSCKIWLQSLLTSTTCPHNILKFSFWPFDWWYCKQFMVSDGLHWKTANNSTLQTTAVKVIIISLQLPFLDLTINFVLANRSLAFEYFHLALSLMVSTASSLDWYAHNYSILHSNCCISFGFQILLR